jgi:hypothetical protein
MLFIKGYYYIFAAAVYLLVGICEAYAFLKNFRIQMPQKISLPYRRNLHEMWQHLHFGKS